jgi:hypothetical protein
VCRERFPQRAEQREPGWGRRTRPASAATYAHISGCVAHGGGGGIVQQAMPGAAENATLQVTPTTMLISG